MDGLSIAASLREVRDATEGGYVRSVYQPTRNSLLIHVYAGRDRRVLLVPRHAAVHLSTLDLANPPKPSSFVMLLRRHLRGGRIVAVRQRGWDRVVTFDIERREGRAARSYEFVAELIGVRGNLHLLEGGKVLGSARRDSRNGVGEAYTSLPPQVKKDPRRVSGEEIEDLLRDDPSAESLARSIDGLGRRTAQDVLGIADRAASPEGRAKAIHEALRAVVSYVDAPCAHVLRRDGRATFYPLPPPAEPMSTFSEALDGVSETPGELEGSEGRTIRSELLRAIARRRRTLEKLGEWLDNAREAERLQALADLLMIHHRDVAPKSSRATLTDPATGREVTVELVASWSAIENAQRLYERAKRLRRGRPHVVSRIERLEREARLLEAAAQDEAAGRAVGAHALALLPRSRPRSALPERVASSRRLDVDGFTVFVGRDARDNDRLLREAAPDDLWLHAKEFAGSHVIVQRGGRRDIPHAVVLRAAQLAAEHSKGRAERCVEVVVTEAKHVRKPKGAPRGLAAVARGDTLTVEPCEEGE